MSWLFYVIIWLLCGFAAAVIYQGKGRSGAAAFIVGLLLGPIGVLLALLSSTDTKGVERRSLASGSQKKCPYCAELIQSAALVCRYCHKEMPRAATVAAVRPYVRRVQESYYCSSCNKGVRPDATTCKHCGANFALA